MGNYYGSGLIGLDVKPKRKGKARSNRYHGKFRWLMPVAVAFVILGLLVLAGAR